MALVEALSQERFWINKSKYADAEAQYYRKSVVVVDTPLAKEVAKARQQLLEIRNQFPNPSNLSPASTTSSIDTSALKFFEKKLVEIQNVINTFESRFNAIESKISGLENFIKQKGSDSKSTPVAQSPAAVPKVESSREEEDDDVDLFGSESEEESEEAVKVREERLAAYNAKKSKKPQLIAKSNIILDIKPWDDETDMKKMEEEVRKIETDGLIWGAAKLVPLAYGIHKLQISCVVEDDKVSIDWLQEEIEKIEDYVQSVDIAAFNKV